MVIILVVVVVGEGVVVVAAALVAYFLNLLSLLLLLMVIERKFRHLLWLCYLRFLALFFLLRFDEMKLSLSCKFECNLTFDYNENFWLASLFSTDCLVRRVRSILGCVWNYELVHLRFIGLFCYSSKSTLHSIISTFGRGESQKLSPLLYEDMLFSVQIIFDFLYIIQASVLFFRWKVSDLFHYIYSLE